uniref:BAH domain and coiled-coil containing 1b n=1 Tax=Cyprinus carpio TaxID=7962 RepID=A0A8C1I586_CYPCA
MEGRDFAPPPHLLAERGALVHRGASRITPAGHTAVQHPGHFQPGKYYPSHIPMPPHSGSGLIGNSSASFMGTFLASSLGSPPSHPSGPPSSPSSPPYRSGPHSTAPSQIWFPHSHEAPGYPRFSGSLAPTFLPMSPLDHHGNSSVLYGQHRFYDSQKDFYLRSLPSQPHLLSTNHSLPPLSRTVPAHPLDSCSREREPGSTASQKSSKETGVAERRVATGGKEKEKSKQESKQDRQHHGHPTLHHQHQHQPQGLEEDFRHKDDPKHLSSCLLSTKTQNSSDPGATTRGSLPSCVGPGASGLGTGRQTIGDGHCCKEGVSGEMRISEPPSDCLRHSAMLGHAHPVPYSIPPPLGLGSAVGGSWLHPSHPHHHHPHHPHPDLFCPPPPAPLIMPTAQEKSLGRDSEVTGPTFVPSVGPQGDKTSGPFQLGNPHCRGVGGGMVAVGGSVGKETKTPERSSSGSRAATLIYASTPPFRDCSHSGPSNRTSSEGKGATDVECTLQRNSQRVARIRHQQHRANTGGQGPELEPGNSTQDKRKMDMESTSQGYSGHQTGTHPSWEVRGHRARPDEEPHKAYNSLGATSQTSHGDQGPLTPLTAPQEATLGPQGPESNAMRSLIKYSSQQPLLFSQKSPFGGLGCLKQGAVTGERSERNERNDKTQGEGEVRQPPVGIAVAVARQREPLCRLPDGHPTHSHHSRVMPSMKGKRLSTGRLREVDEDVKRVCEEQLGLPPYDREREHLLRENKDRVDFARIHPSSSCHGDLTSHLIVPGGSQLGTEPSAHAHPAHHHWMPRTGSPSLWMGHSYSLSHAALHQNLAPRFSATMPSPLQPVLPLPQDPSAALVVLPTEPAAHPATHHLDVMEQQGLWPPVYGARGPASHMQHPAVYSRSQFLRQQELYALQQHQHQQHRAAQRKPEDPPIDLVERSSELRTSKHTKPFSVGPSTKPPPSSSSPGGCASRLSPCCRSPAPRSHLKSTPCTPCPEPSPAVAAPCSPALSPHATPHHLPKPAESQDKRGEGQPPQDYPQSLEPGEWENDSIHVCPVKGTMETLDREELAMRVRLAELQRRYKEKQRELAKLQRKHDHQKEETSRSPARRGPGRPRKRKSTSAPPIPTDAPKKQAKGRAVSRLLESFAADEGFRMDDDSSFSEGEEEEEEEEEPEPMGGALQALPNCILTKEILRDGLKVLISKEDELLYAAYIHTLDLPDIYSVVVEGERRNRQRIYSLEQLLQEAVLDVQPETLEILMAGTRVCAYWSERSRCLYPGYVRKGSPGEEQKEGCIMVEFDDGDRGWISLSNIRLLPPGYQIHCAEPSPVHLVSPSCHRRKTSTQEKQADGSSECSVNAEPRKNQYLCLSPSTGRPKSVTASLKSCASENVTETASPLLGWPVAAMSRRKPSMDLFQFNGLTKKALRGKESDMFPLLSSTMTTPAKGIFSTSFEVDSFSSIANGCTSFGNQQLATGLPLSHKGIPGLRGRKSGDRKEFLVKLDHEGVTSPKTKNGKALLLLGNPEVNSCHLLKSSSDMRKHPQGLGLSEYADYGPNCHSDCLSSYSDMDEDEDEEEDARRAAMRTSGHFLSRLSVSSSSSGSSSASSSGSLSSSSICSSDNDSSYSSDEEEASRLLLQGCLSSHHTLLQQQQHPESPTAPPRHTFGAKTMTISNSKTAVNSSTGKPQRRKEIAKNSSSVVQSKSSKDFPKKQKIPTSAGPPNSSSFMPGRQLWRWSGNPTQRRGLKGKARKLFYKAIVRGKDTVQVGDCAVFLSAGRPHLPFIGRIESLWESWSSNMVVKVKWFYHPEETKLGKRHRDGKHALYQSSHEDENDVQTISHKCQVVSRAEYERLSRIRKPNSNSQDLYYLAGTYDPTSGQLVTAEGESIIC